MEIKKVVIPCAGLGTRFLPLTKTIPKEMLPLLNKPAIQYIVEEALNSEIDNFFIITGKGKESIADHFDTCEALKLLLQEKNKSHLIINLEKIIKAARFSYIRQCEQLGLGHAISMAQHSIGKEYFAVMLPDDIIISKTPALAQMLRVARQEKACVIAIQEVPVQTVSSYGIISVKKQITPNLFQVGSLVEKPDPKNSPSNLAIIGRYILSSKIFASINEIQNNEGEIQLTDAIAHMIRSGEKVFAYKVQGVRYDIGTPIGWAKAVIGVASQDPEAAPHIEKFISELNTLNSFLYDNSKTIEHS